MTINGTSGRHTDLDELNPLFRGVVEDMLERIEAKGLPFVVYETYRSPWRQAELYLSGRVQDANGKWARDKTGEAGQIVTNAGPYQSAHNFGLAVDFVLRIPGVNPWQMSGYRWMWHELGSIGKTLGLEWGGDWRAIKDYPHFELPRWRSHRERGWWVKRQKLLQDAAKV